MNRGLLSGLDKAEKSPYAGWNTFVHSYSPEKDDVCLLDDDHCDSEQQGSSSSGDSRKCLSDGLRSPKDFTVRNASFKIPKKSPGPPDNKGRKGQAWIESSFNEDAQCGGCQTKTRYQKPRNNINCAGKRKSLDENAIGYRLFRQGLCTPKTRWKHANPPGTFSSLRSANATSSAKQPSGSQVTSAHTSEQCNGSVSADTAKSSVQRSCSSLDKEKRENLSVLDKIMEGKAVEISCNADSDDGILKSEDNDSDSNFRKKSRLSETPNSSKDILSDDNYDDCFYSNYCEKCTGKLSLNKKCPCCDKDIFPSQAATPRKPLSADRFYSQTDDKKLNVQRKYHNRSRGVPKLLQPGTVEKLSDAKKSTNETSQTNFIVKKRKNQRKSNSEDSDSEQKPQVKKKRNGRQTKLTVPKKVDVITLSDEEDIVEATTELVVEESESTVKKPTIIPESPVNQDIVTKGSVVESSSAGTDVCPEVAKKQKTVQSKVEQNINRKTENVHGYTRDDLEIEIMLGQDVRLGTLACTATKPLRITCHNDEIKLDIDYAKKNCSLTILGKDLASFKFYTNSNPGVIVLGVTPGYALKLKQRIPNKGTFLNPGSAVAAERDIVLEVNEHIKPEVMADLMEWVTDKLSKEFAELSIKEVERIMSYKASSSSTSKQNQSSDEASSSAMSTRSRTYNTRTNSNKQPTQTPQKLIVYPPPPQPGGITVTTEDIGCLDSGEFLNDVIIDFYLKYVFFEKLKPEDRARTHILSSFFYKRLTQRKNNNNDTFTSTPDRMHSQVRTWTKNVDIFEKDFVIVPINESSHWYLAVICFAGHENPTYVNEINDDDETDNKNEATDTETGTEEEREHGDDDDDFEFSPLAALRKKPTTRNSRKSLSKQIVKSQPCILVFDSLGGSRARCMFNLRNYLKCEWRERKKEPATRIFDKDTIKGSHPKVPQQDNFCDCGVYVLQYMESFFEDPITDFSLPIKKPNWFSSVAQKRTEIRDLIYTLKANADVDGNT
ncbi:hypothetical protein ACROYT_G020612 [Oculina patagonica]